MEGVRGGVMCVRVRGGVVWCVCVCVTAVSTVEVIYNGVLNQLTRQTN